MFSRLRSVPVGRANEPALKLEHCVDGSQRFADAVAEEENFRTWFDLIPDTNVPFILEVGDAPRRGLA